MNSQELLETYGKAAAAVKAYYFEKFMDSIENVDLPDNFKEFAKEKGVDNETVAKMIDAMPRGLFDVLDKYEVYININIAQVADEVVFSHHIAKPVNSVYAPFSTRTEAERAGIEEAFQILNDKL